MTDVAVDTLRLRGPHARRLAAVASRALPAALDRAMADVEDVHIDEVVIRLDLDLTKHDDETLAVLWADAIRAQVLAARRARAPDGSSLVSVAEPEPVGARALGPTDVLAALRALGAPVGGSVASVPRAAMALADPGTARAVAEAIGPREWASLLRALARTLPPWLARSRQRDPAPVDRAPSAPPHLLPETTAADPAVEERPPNRFDAIPDGEERPTGWADAVPDGVDLPEEPHAILEVLAVVAGLVDEHAMDVEATTLTRVAGLVLLYPWLAEHCRRAEDLHPHLDSLDVREAALAAIVDPADIALADDPLVGLLAGRTSPGPNRSRRHLPRQHDVVESAVEVLTSFAALLPGFERSSPAFIRESWIARLGVLDADRDPVRLTATTHPLDVVLPRLPYPVGLIKLPWSPPLTVRFRP